MKPYDVGLICGRFQTFHKGHEKLIDTGLLLCDRLLIFIQYVVNPLALAIGI